MSNLGLLSSEINPEEIEDTPELTLTDGRRVCRTYRVVRKSNAEQCNDIKLIYYVDGRRRVQSSRLRYFFRFEMEHFLARSGFEVQALYSAFDHSPFTDGCPEMVFIATRLP